MRTRKTMKQDAMTIEELIEALVGYDPKTPVYFATKLGPLTGLEAVTDLSLQKAKFTEELDIAVVAADGTRVIALESS